MCVCVCVYIKIYSSRKVNFVHLLLCNICFLDRKHFASSLQHLVHWVDFKIKLVTQTAQLRRKASCFVLIERQAWL